MGWRLTDALPQGPDPGAGPVLRQAFPRSSAWPVARKSHKKHISICCCQRIVNLATVRQNLTIKNVLRNGQLQQSLYRSHTKSVLQISQLISTAWTYYRQTRQKTSAQQGFTSRKKISPATPDKKNCYYKNLLQHQGSQGHFQSLIAAAAPDKMSDCACRSSSQHKLDRSNPDARRQTPL